MTYEVLSVGGPCLHYPSPALRTQQSPVDNWHSVRNLPFSPFNFALRCCGLQFRTARTSSVTLHYFLHGRISSPCQLLRIYIVMYVVLDATYLTASPFIHG